MDLLQMRSLRVFTYLLIIWLNHMSSTFAFDWLLLPLSFQPNHAQPPSYQIFKIAKQSALLQNKINSFYITEQQLETQADLMTIFNQGNALLMAGDFTQALEQFNLAIKKSPNNEDIYLARGIAYEKLLQWDNAIQDYKKANEIYKSNLFHGDDPVAFSNLANAETGLFKWEDALRHFTYAASLKADYEAPRLGRSFVLYQLNQDTEAIAYFTLLTSKYPEFADGNAAMQGKMAKQSIMDLWEDALEQDSRYLDVDWLENIRRWPPRLMQHYKEFRSAVKQVT